MITLIDKKSQPITTIKKSDGAARRFKTSTVQDIDRPSPYDTCPKVDVRACNYADNPLIINNKKSWHGLRYDEVKRY
jgi:hypothetical protein